MPRPYNPLSYGDPTQIAAARAQLPPRPPAVAGHVAGPARLAADALLSLSEFASLVRRHPRTVRGWLRDGLVPAVRIGRAKFIPASAVHKWLFGNHQISENGIESNSTQVKAYTTTSDTLSMAPIPEFPAFSPFNQR